MMMMMMIPRPLSYLWQKSGIFSYPIYDQKFSTLFITVTVGTVTINIIDEGLLMMVFSLTMKKQYPGATYTYMPYKWVPPQRGGG